MIKIITPFVVLLVLVTLGFAQTTEPAQSAGTPAFSLSTGDVSRAELLMGKHIGKTMLRIAYSREKQAEFSKIAGGNLQKTVKIVLNGKVVSGMLVTKPEMGSYLDVIMDSMDEATENTAFAIAKALVNPMQTSGTSAPAVSPAPASDAVVFSLSSDQHISKVVVVIFKANSELEVTFPSQEKIDEWARITKDNIGKRLRIMLNGRLVQEETIEKPGWGHVVKVEMASPEEAFEMAKALINPTPQPETKTP